LAALTALIPNIVRCIPINTGWVLFIKVPYPTSMDIEPLDERFMVRFDPMPQRAPKLCPALLHCHSYNPVCVANSVVLIPFIVW